MSAIIAIHVAGCLSQCEGIMRTAARRSRSVLAYCHVLCAALQLCMNSSRCSSVQVRSQARIFCLSIACAAVTSGDMVCALPPNDPSSATRPTRASDCNREAMAGFAAAHG